jgi:neutral trehalase
MYLQLAHHSGGNTESGEDKQKIYHELKTGAETGWDFSSRWYITPDGSDKPGELKDTRYSYFLMVSSKDREGRR